jgi:hypothetical protein
MDRIYALSELQHYNHYFFAIRRIFSAVLIRSTRRAESGNDSVNPHIMALLMPDSMLFLLTSFSPHVLTVCGFFFVINKIPCYFRSPGRFRSLKNNSGNVILTKSPVILTYLLLFLLDSSIVLSDLRTHFREPAHLAGACRWRSQLLTRIAWHSVCDSRVNKLNYQPLPLEYSL